MNGELRSDATLRARSCTARRWRLVKGESLTTFGRHCIQTGPQSYLEGDYG